MSNEIFILSIAAIGLIGLSLATHLIFFGKDNITAKMLGWYTLLLTVSSLEPLKKYFSGATHLFEIALATGSFLIGPMLFLYCKYRIVNRIKWKRKDILHFIPAGIILLLMMVSPASSAHAKHAAQDVILYLIFIGQVFSYTLISLSLIWKERKRLTPGFSLQQFHLTFTLFLVVGSLVLFLYSFASTLLGVNNSFHFELFVQAFLTLIIVVIVLLNAETLENHGLRDEPMQGGNEN